MKSSIIKSACLAVFLIITSGNSAYSAYDRETLTHPDFAFPQTVEKDSRAMLETSLHENRPAATLRAFLNLAVASDLISRENAFTLLPDIDSISNLLSSPYKAIGLLIEAQMYQEIYLSNPGVFNSRTVPAVSYTDNPNFWDRNMFASKIDSLSLKAVEEFDCASKVPLKNIESIIESRSSLASYTVGDFIIYKVIDLVQSVKEQKTIPFFSSPTDDTLNPLTLIDRLLSLHPKISAARCNAILTKAGLLEPHRNEPSEFLWNEIIASGTHVEVAQLLTYYYQRYVSWQ